jgi:hypothetical protein
MSDSLVDTIRQLGLLDAGVLAVGLQRGFARAADVAEYAAERMRSNDDSPELMELSRVDGMAPERACALLLAIARRSALASQTQPEALRRWLFAALTRISASERSGEEMLDMLEDVYATLGYPEELKVCSRYYVPPADRVRGIRVGEFTESPVEAMNGLLSQLKREYG